MKPGLKGWYDGQRLTKWILLSYYLCEKSDGIRCLLYLTAEGPKEIQYLIDRRNQYYYIPPYRLHFPKAPEPPQQDIDWASFHVGTILDGELLIDTYPDGQTVKKFLVFDCLVMAKQNMMTRTLDKRLAYFKDKLYSPYKALCAKFPDDAKEFMFRLEEKKFQLGYGVELMVKQEVPKLMHGSDGLIFTCRETPYKFGTDENILKWKPAWENTIDYQLELKFPTITGDEEEIGTNHNSPWEHDYDAQPGMTLHSHYGDDNRAPREERTLYATSEEWDGMKEYSIAHDDGLDGAIVECHRDEEGRWRFNRFREDKTDANHYTVVEKVLQSIEDGVTEEELITNAVEVRTAWKLREKVKADVERKQREAAQEAERKRMEAKRKAEFMKKEEEKRMRQEDPAEEA